MISAVKAVARSLGWDIFVRPYQGLRKIGGYSYERVWPTAEYAPWRDDAEFLEIYSKIDNNTLVDVYRCYELWSLLRQVSRVPGEVLEVGVWRGGTGAVLARAAVAAGKTVYLSDTFKGVVKATKKDSSYVNGEHSDTSRPLVEKFLADNGLTNTVILEGIFPDDFPGEGTRSFSFVHIDVDVYESARQIMDNVWPHMPVGGIVVFDDFGFATCDGIARLVSSYIGISDRYVLQNLNGHAILVKLA